MTELLISDLDNQLRRHNYNHVALPIGVGAANVEYTYVCDVLAKTACKRCLIVSTALYESWARSYTQLVARPTWGEATHTYESCQDAFKHGVDTHGPD